jgi:hypothetical protein
MSVPGNEAKLPETGNLSGQTTEKPYVGSYSKSESDAKQISKPLSVDPATIAKHRNGTIPNAPTNGLVSA